MIKILEYDFDENLHYFIEFNLFGWLKKMDDNILRLGVTDFFQSRVGKIFNVKTRPMGTNLKNGMTLLILECENALLRGRTPVSGMIHSINPLILENPTIINKDPYGNGWIYELKVNNVEEELSRENIFTLNAETISLLEQEMEKTHSWFVRKFPHLFM